MQVLFSPAYKHIFMIEIISKQCKLKCFDSAAGLANLFGLCDIMPLIILCIIS